MSSTGFEDIIGVGSAEGGPGTNEGTQFNIDDENYFISTEKNPSNASKFWDTSALSLGVLPPIEHEPLTCGEICKRNIKEREKKCTIVRKRVAEAMKRAGCPSKVEATKSSSKKKSTYRVQTGDVFFDAAEFPSGTITPDDAPSSGTI